MTKDPRSESLVAARMARAYPQLSTYSAASLAEELCRIERAQRRHAERCCSGEDGGYTMRRESILRGGSAMLTHDPAAEHRAGMRIVGMLTRWKSKVARLVVPAGVGADDGSFYREDMMRVASYLSTHLSLHGDPRGAVLTVQFPGEREAVAV